MGTTISGGWRKSARGAEPPRDGSRSTATSSSAELRVHQAELEMQNDELRRTQVELQTAHDSYLDLFELAPIGYLVLGARAQIVSANLAAGELLGRRRATG